MIDRDLFLRLLAVRPKRTVDIAHVAKRWAVEGIALTLVVEAEA